jgi:hypothetical protein
MRTWPEVGRSIAAATCSSVVFPDPDGPITAVNCPDAKPIVTLSSAVTARLPEP